uniref:hypothetical protein n=1 Tax=Salmonella sp. s54925 TaxID=3159674 RepID=UPI00397E9578
QQVVRVIDIPMSDDDDKFMIWYGLKVTFPDLVVDKNDPAKNPFTRDDFTYKITFAGREREEREMMVTLKDNVGWFDNVYLNKSPRA